MPHEDYIRQAMKMARRSEHDGGVAIGAVLVKDGDVFAEGTSSVWRHDPSGHAEINCLRAGCSKLSSTDLSDGYILYTTLEPCGMCLSCAAWAQCRQVVFGAYRQNVAGNDYEIDDFSAEELARRLHFADGQRMEVTGGILSQECADLLQGYRNWLRTPSGSLQGVTAPVPGGTGWCSSSFV